jgi:hypothetical protein
MNIFYVNENVKICAQSLDDLRLNKMILETAQLLSSAVLSINPDIQGLYKKTHVNHPCSIWARQSYLNFFWLCNLGKAYAREKYRRTNKVHKSLDIIELARDYSYLFSKTENFTIPPNCTTYKQIKSTKEAYKQYLSEKWNNDIRPPKWTNCNPPEWYEMKVAA